MNFQEQLQQQLAQQNSGDREKVDYPSSHLKNKELFFPKAVNGSPSSLLVRILPPATPGENYNVSTREIFMQARNRNGKDLKFNAVLSAFPNQEDFLERAIIDWQARNMVPNNYNRSQKPSTKYLCNVVQIVQNPQTGQYEEERDPQTGELVVRMLKLPYSACQSVNEKLMDMLLRPQALSQADPSIAQYSFISSLTAFPIGITKPTKDSGKMNYEVNVYSNIPLGALPQGWENSLEDLNYQATPSYEYNKDYAEYFISVVNGTEPVAGQSQSQQAPTQGNYQAPGMPVAPTQPVAPVQPVAPTQPFQATNMGTPPTMPTPPTPTYPTQVTDATLPSNLTSMPNIPVAPVAPTPVAPTQPVASMPTPATEPAPVQETVTAPVGTPSGLPDINDLLAGMNPNK